MSEARLPLLDFFQGHKPTHVFKTRIVGGDWLGEYVLCVLSAYVLTAYMVQIQRRTNTTFPFKVHLNLLTKTNAWLIVPKVAWVLLNFCGWMVIQSCELVSKRSSDHSVDQNGIVAWSMGPVPEVFFLVAVTKRYKLVKFWAILRKKGRILFLLLTI